MYPIEKNMLHQINLTVSAYLDPLFGKYFQKSQKSAKKGDFKGIVQFYFSQNVCTSEGT
jgi:hypothetical protein